MMRQTNAPGDMEELGIEITELIEAANENGVAREEIEDVLNRHVNWVNSDRGREQLDGYEEIHR
jgi:hypothetical protein